MILPLRIELAITLTFGPRNLAPGVAIKRACKTGLAISARPYRFWRQRPVELGSGRLCFPAEAPLDLARVATVLEPGPICRAARPARRPGAGFELRAALVRRQGFHR